MASTTPRQRVGNLPAEVSSFVDRREEIAETKRLLSVTRLLTLTGVGGVGKTRLALRVAADLRRAFANGVWLVELAGLQNPHLVVDTVVEALGIDDRSTRGQLAVLIHYLRGRQLLLVLDNCEHLRSACAILVDALLRAAKGLRVLATSRQVLDTDGERAWQVRPLPAPDPDLPLPPRAGARYPALALFAERATARGFVITADTQGPVARICHRLDGIPLAIELAAVRLRTMQPEQILQRLDDRFGLLTAGTRTALPRHQTLRAAIEWSFDLCTREEQLLWARASVFADGFDLATAEEVCAGDGLAADVILDLVAGLADKSVLICEEHAGTMRYRLLDTLRQYGRERLRYAGEQEGVRRRHRNWYLRLAEQGEAEWFGPHQATWFARMRLERANMRAALDFCLSEPDEIQTGLRMAAALWFYWSACGFPREGRHWLDRALALDTGLTREGVRARWANGWIALQQGHIADGESTLTECRALARQLGDASTLAHATHRLGFAALLRGDLSRAVALLEESLTRFRFLGELNSLVIMAQVGLAAANVHQGDLDRAMMLCEEARAICGDTASSGPGHTRSTISPTPSGVAARPRRQRRTQPKACESNGPFTTSWESCWSSTYWPGPRRRRGWANVPPGCLAWRTSSGRRSACPGSGPRSGTPRTRRARRGLAGASGTPRSRPRSSAGTNWPRRSSRVRARRETKVTFSRPGTEGHLTDALDS
jgi:predicted ATPase